MVQIKGSVQDSVSTPEFDMKHLKKAEGYIDWNVVIITIKMRSVVQILKEIMNLPVTTVASEVIIPYSLCYSTMLEVDVDGMAVEIKLPW